MKIIFSMFFFVFLLLSPLFFNQGFIGNFGDLNLHYYPLKHHISERLIAGETPLWNPYVFGGTPLLANPQSGIFYPVAQFFYFFPIKFAFKLWLLSHLFLLFLFMFILMKHFLKDNLSAFVSSFIFVFSSYVIYLIPAGHLILLAGWSWLPIVAFFYIKILNKKSVSMLILAAIAMAFQFFSGHPQATFVTFIFIFVILAFNKFSGRKRTIFFLLLFASAVSVQLLPSLELSTMTEDIFWKPLARAYSLEFQNLLSLIFPNYQGNPLQENYEGSISYFFTKNNLYFGAVSLALSICGIYYFIKDFKNHKRAGMFFNLIPIGFLLASGFNTSLYELLYDIPVWNFFRTPCRFYIIALIGFCFFVGVAIKKIPQKFKFIIVVAFFELFMWSWRFIYTIEIPVGRSEFSNIYDGANRIFTTPEISANLSMLYHHYNLNGYDALILKDYFRSFYSHFAPPEKSPPSTFLDLNDYSTLLDSDFSGWGMRYILTTENLDGKYFLQKSGAVNVYEKKNFSPFIFVPETLSSGENNPLAFKLKSYKTSPEKTKIEVEVEKDGALVIGESYYPGWQAWSNGKRINLSRGEKICRLLFLDESDKKVYIIFNPITYKIGVALTIATVLFLLAYIYYRKLCFT